MPSFFFHRSRMSRFVSTEVASRVLERRRRRMEEQKKEVRNGQEEEEKMEKEENKRIKRKTEVAMN